MRTLTLTNLSLILIIAVLYWQINLPKKTVAEHTILSNMNANDISDITIYRQDRDEIQLSKKEGRWFIKHPLQAAANQTRIKLLLNVLSQKSYNQYKVHSEQDLQKFNLDPPLLILNMNQHSFRFGNTESLSQHRYIQHQGLIHLIDDVVSPLLNSTAASFVNNRLFAEHLQIRQLQLPLLKNNPIKEIKAETITITMKDGHWYSDYPNSADQLSTLIANWQHAYAMQVSVATDEQIMQENAHKLSISFEGIDNAMDILLHINESTLTLTKPLTRLQYHFPLATVHQLFILKEQH